MGLNWKRPKDKEKQQWLHTLGGDLSPLTPLKPSLRQRKMISTGDDHVV